MAQLEDLGIESLTLHTPSTLETWGLGPKLVRKAVRSSGPQIPWLGRNEGDWSGPGGSRAALRQAVDLKDVLLVLDPHGCNQIFAPDLVEAYEKSLGGGMLMSVHRNICRNGFFSLLATATLGRFLDESHAPRLASWPGREWTKQYITIPKASHPGLE